MPTFTLPTKIIAGLGIIAFILLMLVMVQNRMGCTTPRQQRREERQNRDVTATVKSVLDGARLTVAWGRRDRLEREVVLKGIEVPSEPAIEAAAKSNLERLTAGGSVRIQYVSKRIFFSSDGEGETEAADTEMEATETIVGVVFGDGGVNLAVEQLRVGLARTNQDATAEMKAAEEAARKAKIGLLAK